MKNKRDGMRVVSISTVDINGGAARAAYRLHKALRLQGVDSKVLVQKKDGDDKGVIGPRTKAGNLLWSQVKPVLDRVPLSYYRKREKNPFHLQWMPGPFQKHALSLKPDLLHLNWICGGFQSIGRLGSYHEKPIIWTLHDMWAFTGGCHYGGDCLGYTGQCGHCPILKSNRASDVSRWTWRRKRSVYSRLNLTIVSPSSWLAECAKKSSLLHNTRIEVIPYAIDTNIFKHHSKEMARNLLNLPAEKKLILFGAMNPTSVKRKGFDHLRAALHEVAKIHVNNDIDLMVFGSSEPHDPPDLGMPVNYLGRFNDEISLSLLYAAADVMVIPSVEDNLPNTVIEALACGTPCVAFNIGGMRDMIDHEENGYLAHPFDSSDLALGIEWVVSDQNRHKALSAKAREKAMQNYESELVAKKYIQLYEHVLNASE